MSILGIFRRATKPPASLLDLLFEAIASNDADGFTSLCATRQQEIRESFPIWKNVPESVRNDRTARTRYAEGLIAIAVVFEQRGDPSLIKLLQGNPADKPVLTWPEDLAKAQTLLDQGKAAEALDLLQVALDKNSRHLGGSAVDHYLPRTQGMLGAAYFNSAIGKRR